MKSIKLQIITIIAVVFIIAMVARVPVGHIIESEIRTIKLKVTAYCPCIICCEEYADGVTASGYVLVEGNKVCAGDFKFGTVLEVPGYGVCTVLDRGGSVGGQHIDVYFDTHQKALDWGVKYLWIKVLN